MATIPLGGDNQKAILAIMVGDRMVVEEKGEMTSFTIERIVGTDKEATITLVSEDDYRVQKTIEYVRVD